MEERPRILIKHDDKKSGRVSPEKKPESPSDVTGKSSFQRTSSSSSDPADTIKHRVTFADDVTEPPGEKETGNVQAPHGSSRRAPMQKIMLRKMGGERDGETAGERGKEVGQGPSGNGRPARPGDLDTAVADPAKPKTAWSSNERGPIISPKTLYEPEGKQSAAKFKKYQAQTREPQSGRGSHDVVATPTSEDGVTPTGEQQDGNKREEVNSPIDRAGQSSPSGKDKRPPPPDHRKGSGRRQEKVEKPLLVEREGHEQHSRAPHHRKENLRRENEHPDVSRTTSRPGRLASPEEEEFGRDDHQGRGKIPPRREPHEENRPTHHRKGDRGQREKPAHNDQRILSESDCSGNIVDSRAAVKPEAEQRQVNDQQLKNFHQEGDVEHKAEHRVDRQQRDEEGWRGSRADRHPHFDRGHPPGDRGERGHLPSDRGERGHPPSERGERSHPPGNRGHPSGERGDRSHPPGERGERDHPPSERGHRPGERVDRGRGGPRRGGDKDYHGGRGGPPPSDRPERGGTKDRDRGGKEGAPRERKASAPHDGEDKSGGRGGRRQTAPGRDCVSENRPPRSRGGAPLLPNPPTQPLFPPTDAIQHHQQLLPTPEQQLQQEARGHTHHPPPLLSSRKSPSDREVKGRNDLGYSEVIDIDSEEDWDNDPETTTSSTSLGSGGAKTRKEQHVEGERGHGHRRGGEPGQRGGRQQRSNRDDSRTQRGREDRRQREDGEGGSGRREGRRGGKGGTREDAAPRHSGQRKSQPHSERKTEDSESVRQRSRTPQAGGGVVKDGKLDAIPSSVSLTHPPKTDFTKYDLNSHKVAIVDDINRGQSSEEGRVSPSSHGEFVEVTSKKSQKERQRKEKEEQKRQEEERRRDENKKKRKQGPSRSGSAGGGSERGQQHTAAGNNKQFTWTMGGTGGMPASVAVGEGELWDTDETLHSHLPAVSAAPGSQLKHLPPSSSATLPSQAPPPAQPIQPSPSSSMWPVETAKPGVPHTAELVTSDYSLFGGTSGLLSHAVDSTLPIATAMAASATVPLSGQSSSTGLSGQKETGSGGDKKDGWTAQAQVTTTNEQELTRDDHHDNKAPPKTEKGSKGRGAAGSNKNLPPRLKSQQESSGPGRGRGARFSGRGSGGERRGPGGKDRGTHDTSEEKKLTATAEQTADKDKVRCAYCAPSLYMYCR